MFLVRKIKTSTSKWHHVIAVRSSAKDPTNWLHRNSAKTIVSPNYYHVMPLFFYLKLGCGKSRLQPVARLPLLFSHTLILRKIRFPSLIKKQSRIMWFLADRRKKTPRTDQDPNSPETIVPSNCYHIMRLKTLNPQNNRSSPLCTKNQILSILIRDLTKNSRHVLKPLRNRGKPRYRSRF